MAAALGIHKADLKVVQVYEGSVIIEFQVLAAEDDPHPKQSLKQIETTFMQQAPLFGDSLGAPIMQIVTSNGEIIAMKGYEDYTALRQNKHFVDLIDEFKRQRDANKNLWETLDDLKDVIAEKYEDHKEETKGDNFELPREDDHIVMNQKPTIVTKTIVKEESSLSQSTQLVLVILVAIMGVIIIGTGVYCLIKRRRTQKPIQMVSANQVQPNKMDMDDIYTVKIYDDEGDEKKQFDANKLGVDYLAPSKKRATTNAETQNTERSCNTPRTDNQTPRDACSSLASSRRMISQGSEDMGATLSQTGAKNSSHS
jgi:hypothetical protein